jgi:hypothetical protein
VLVYPFFEPTRLLSKKVPQWSFLLCFFRLSKYEKSLSFPSLGSLNLHRRTLPLCVLSTAFASFTLQPSNSLPLRLNTFGHWRIFLEYHFLRTSVLSLCLELVCLLYSFLPCNVIFLYSFFPNQQKEPKKSNIPQKEDGKSIFFIGNIMSRPWIKHICPFDSSDFGM